MMQALPIDEHLPRILALMEESPLGLLCAEPGAGKTTRVPAALAAAPWAVGRSVWVLQPRRLAALVAAWRVSEEQGQGQPGGFVGYHFRFDRKESRETRLLFLTEGMFLRRLQADPDLNEVACVVLDEFHERSLDVDLALALLRRLRERRPDLKLLIMSATLDARSLSASLGDCPVLECPGRAHAVELSYLEQDRSDPQEPIERRAVRGLRGVASGDGDILVFLPGTAEIRRTADRLAGDPFFDSRRVLALHGQLSPEEQKRALGPADKPKIILSTNVAETSLTVPGVRVVVDSGLTRRDAFNPFSGLSALVTLPASQASMTQRAGRAGREAPGRCLRLCSSAEYQARPRFDPPELQRADLAQALLQALAAGFGDLGELPWIEAPPPAHVEAARALLRELGALDAGGGLSAKGKALARAPLHPRLGAVAWEARAGSETEWNDLMACLALLEAGRLRELDFFTALRRFEAQGPSRLLLRQLTDWLDKEKERPSASQGPWDLRLTLALMRAFPDQVAFTRQGTDKRGQTRFVLATGGEADCRSDSFSTPPGFYLLMEIVESRALGQAAGLPRVQSLVALQPDWLLEALPERVKQVALVSFDAGGRRVQARERLAYGVLVLDEGEARSQASRDAAAELLLREARKAGLQAFCGEGQPDRYLARRAFVLQSRAEAELPGEEALWAEVGELARAGALSFEALRQADPLRLVLDRAPAARRLLDELAPGRLRLPSGRETTVHYPPGQAAWVGSRLQDFFGMRETPKAAGRPLTVHLLAPNQRPQQVTQDLAGFWQREYPRVRKELMRKYPRHAWPEDPLA
ncbi:MAG TPA: ATP-dependent helicase HrpB [bacterium]|jgi:ATP-dependent helicase HrpB|nr:ATP-dependent helicase HrpB [bacterium]